MRTLGGGCGKNTQHTHAYSTITPENQLRVIECLRTTNKRKRPNREGWDSTRNFQEQQALSGIGGTGECHCLHHSTPP